MVLTVSRIKPECVVQGVPNLLGGELYLTPIRIGSKILRVETVGYTHCLSGRSRRTRREVALCLLCATGCSLCNHRF